MAPALTLMTFSGSKLTFKEVKEKAGRSYAVFDLIGTLQLSEHSRVQWGVFNLGDLTYHRWTDVRGLPDGDLDGGSLECEAAG